MIRLLALVAILGTAMLLIALVGIAAFAGRADHDVADAQPERRGASSELVVIVHAMRDSPADLRDVRDVVAAQRPDADILMPRYASGVFANTDPREIAAALDARIQALVDRAAREGRRYARIVLVGHGVGALLARRTYLYGKGYRADYVPADGRRRYNGWVDDVERIVLLAGMNRGWSSEPRTTARDRVKQLLLVLGERVARVTGTGGLLLSVRRGAPFVVNLRAEWIRFARAYRPPTVIQLLGDADDLVSAGDDSDQIGAPRFVFMNVLGAGHDDLVRFGDSPDPVLRRRRQKVAEALTENVANLEARYPPSSDLLAEDPRITHVVFVKQGVQDITAWTDRIRRLIEREDPTVKVLAPTYDDFPMASFLLFADRQKKVRKFADEYAEALARYPHADRFSFLGHGNGTYLLASAVERYDALRFHRIYFAGSIVRRDFDWGARATRIDAVRNDMAAADWVVAIFPRVFEQARRIPWLADLAYLDVGSAGFNGFDSDIPAHLQFAYFDGGHGAALAADMNAYSVADFILEEDLGHMSRPIPLLPAPSGWLRLASDYAWLVWVLLLAAIVGLGCVLWRRAPARGTALCVYVAGVLVLLYTV